MEVAALTPATARFLLGLLDQQQLTVGAPDFEEAAASVIRARQELVAIAEAGR